jgi:excisionase family DNA binding protein
MTNTLLITVEEGAARLGVSRDWYMRQLRARKLPGHKLNNKWRLSEQDLADALDITAMPASVVHADPAGLTPRSRSRINRNTSSKARG